MDASQVKNIVEASLLVAGRAMTVAQLEALFEDDSDKPDRAQLRETLATLQAEYEDRGIELVEVASGFRLQSRAAVEHWVARLFQEKMPRYSRALLETLVLIAYRQPITRGEIEEVRGVAVSSSIIRTLQERSWVKVLGHREVPGRPALLGTTRQFLDYFNLKRLEDLPPLGEIKDIDQIDPSFADEVAATEGQQSETANDQNRQGNGVPGGDHNTDIPGIGVPMNTVDVEPFDENNPTTPETDLQRVIANFARDHQKDIDVQRAYESHTMSQPPVRGDEEKEVVEDAVVEVVVQEKGVVVEAVVVDAEVEPAEFADAIPEAVDESFSDETLPEELLMDEDAQPGSGRHVSDMPKPGDTLH